MQEGLEAKVNMRSFLIAVTGLVLFATGAAQANIAITVDKNAQLMTVAVDGVERYQWPVSTGLPVLRDAERQLQDLPDGGRPLFQGIRRRADAACDLLHQIGHAIHGTDSVNRLGSPASHGCVRLSRANAATLYALVEKDGVLNATVTLTGSSQVALARNPRPRANTAVARRDAGRRNAATPPAIRSCWRRGRACPARSCRFSRRRRPTTATSIRPTAPRTRRAIRRRAAGASMARRSIRGSNITMIAAMRRNTRRRAITSRGTYYQPRGLFTYQD